MSKHLLRHAMRALIVVFALSLTGCFPTLGPSLGILGVPVPLSPYYQDKLEDKAWDEERYANSPILDPIPPGVPHIALDPPSEDEVMRAFEEARPLEGGVPYLHEKQRSNVRIVTELIDDHVDPPRVHPLVGPAQMHSARYKCTIYFSETTRVGWPIPYTIYNDDAREVIYIDHSHLHRVAGSPQAGAPGEF